MSVLLVVGVLAAGAGAPARAVPAVFGEPPSDASPAGGAAVAYRLPVADAAVLRGFEQPATPYGAGHRGVDLDVPAGRAVRAAAVGRVVHAGSVAAQRWVTVEHADGVRTSYGPLVRLGVRPGQLIGDRVVLGQRAPGGHGHGGSDGGLHFGARLGGRYLDPLALVGAAPRRPSLVGPGSWTGSDHAVVGYEPWSGARAAGWLVAASPVADRAGYAVPPNANHLVVLQGLATSSETAAIDPTHLGYDLRSVTAFSYAGRDDARTGASGDTRRDQLPYGPPDTWEGVPEAAVRLAAQLRVQARREPGRAVDLLGHSMGGVVALYYLTHLHDPYDVTLPQIGNIVTVGSPVRGSNLAAVASQLGGHPLLGPVVAAGARVLAAGDGPLGASARRLPLDAPAIPQLSVGSELLSDLALAWDRVLHEGAAGPAGTGTRVLTIGGSTDAVVVADRAKLPDLGRTGALERVDPIGHYEHVLARRDSQATPPGAEQAAPFVAGDVSAHRVLPGGHHDVLDTQALREVVWRFLAERDVVESPGRLTSIVGRELGDTASDGATVLRLVAQVRLPLRLLQRRGTPTPLGPP